MRCLKKYNLATINLATTTGEQQNKITFEDNEEEDEEEEAEAEPEEEK